MTKHEKENVKETDTFERRQKSPPANHEKGASDQKFSIGEIHKIFEVGHTGNDRTGDAASERVRPASRSGWFDDPTKEIGDATSSSQFEFGWFYVRTETGHRRERTARRDSVS